MTTREVELTGGAPWGFRMHGGADQNQPLRISRVNPGRKASLSGIREGDVISSINGQPTKTMTNADAHAMLRSSGPVLRLGLNEDREMSPRRRSIGRTSELKRPSHLLSEVDNKIATLQAPVYATIRPANSSQNRPTPSLSQYSLNSLPASLNSTSLKSGVANEEPFQFHPTNPFYTTVSSNHLSASKLPIPNGKASLSSLDRNKSISKPKENFLLNEQDLNGRSPSYISLTDDSGPHSTIFSNYVDTANTNGYDSETSKLHHNDKDGHFMRDNNSKTIEATNSCDDSIKIKLNEKNPFQTKRNSDPFEKYLRPNGIHIENFKEEKPAVPISISDSDIHKNELKTNHLSVTEHKISETEEITTIKKFVFNGATENETQDEKVIKLNTPSHSELTKNKYSFQDTSPAKEFYRNIQCSPQKDLNSKSTLNSNNYFVSNEKHENEFNNYSNKPLQEECNNCSPTADTFTGELVVTKPPLKSPSVPGPVSLVPKHNQETSCVFDTYTVESPDQSNKSQSKLSNKKKSKSVDDDESPRIVEIIEDIPSENSIIALDACSDIEWEKTLDLEENNLPKIEEPITGTLSITTIPLTVAHCEQPKLLSTEDELSLRHYLQTLNLATHPTNSIEIKTEIEQIINSEIKRRLRKTGLAEEAFTQRLGPPRILDVIDEEGSGESSVQSRRHSYLSDKKSDNDDLEDDVFEKPSQQSNLKKITDTQFNNNVRKKPSAEQIPQKCLLVGAKLKEPEICEARGNWTIQTVEKMTGAEVVYLTDSSSSTSSIHDAGDDIETEEETDTSVRMITPTIEVTDTENFLKKTFITNNTRYATNPIRQSSNDLIVSKESMLSKTSKQGENNAMDPSRHEIEVLSTDNLKTNLIVKDINESEVIHDNLTSVEMTRHKSASTNSNSELKLVKHHYDFDLEMKVLKCELNDAINNLIKEVSDSESANENSKETLTRQDSSSSVSSSQCTAIYNPNSSLLNELSSNIYEESYHNSNELKDGSGQSTAMSHVNDVFEHVTGTPTQIQYDLDNKARQPKKLRDICVERISSLPFGFKILEELANVSLRLQNMNTFASGLTKEINKNSSNTKILKPDCAQSTSSFKETTKSPKNHNSNIKNANKTLSPPSPPPPPIQPRHSSLKKSKEDHQISEKSTSYVCLSPSQKMLMEKTHTVVTQENSSPVVDLRKNSVDRKDEIHTECTESIITKPFKSQTGSRLLAFICDPAITSNITSRHFNKFGEKQPDSTSKIQIEPTKSYRKYSDQESGVASSQDVFKPIPPPRPKKLLSSFYERDVSTNFDKENSLNSMKRERKFFHFSTGNLNKEIEDDISTIQSMHKNYLDVKNRDNEIKSPRRPSLPQDICDQQMEYIRQKEKEVDAEIRRLEEEKFKPLVKKSPRAPMIDKKEIYKETMTKTYRKPYIKDEVLWSSHIPEKEKKDKKYSLFSNSQEEILRDKMYSEYRNEIAEREQRKQHKIIKITNSPTSDTKIISKSMSALDVLDSSVNNRIEKEFIFKARERWNKLGIKDPESEDERKNMKNVYKEPKVIEHKIKVIEAGEEKDVYKLPNHLQEFVTFTAKDKEQESESSAVWRPGASPPAPRGSPSESPSAARSPSAPPPPPPPPVWTPTASPQTPRKTFRPVHFEDTPPARRKFMSGEQNGCTSGSESEGRLRTSQSAPATGLSALGGTSSSRLPRAQNPTVTLLQKARENQLSRAPSNIYERDPRLPRDRPSPPIGDPVHALRKGYLSEGEVDRGDYVHGGSHKMAEATRKIEGIGPTTKEGMPVALRSEVKDPSRWYKKMYDTIHKNKYDDDYVTIRYKNRQGQPPLRVSSSKSQYAYFDPRSGYLSEPEGGRNRLGSSTWSDAYDSDATTGPRRRTASVQEDRRDEAFSSYISNNKYSTLASARASQEIYKNQPGRIENYVPGKSSVVDKEAKQWWDEVMDIFDGWLDDNSPLPPYTTLLARAIQKSQNVSSTTSLPQTSPKEKKDLTSTILSKSNMARALKESGYESDSTLVFRRREENDAPLSPAERRAAYRDLQAGGEPPLRGFRSPAPPRQETDSAPEPPRRIPHGSYSDTESPSRRYVESDVNIHYRCPVRHDPLPLVPERELARQQAEHMKRLYREQKRNKYLQELQDMQNRRHQDNFMPSQKTVVPLNRYDEAEKLVARALYAFNGQTTRELSFKKGDLINVRRQIDANWYEGEVHGRIGLFPYNYVEILKGDYVHSPKKPMIIEGQARAKFDFTAQTNLELPLKKGEIVVLTRRIDHNWWEGRNGTKTGIFPDSYVTVLQEPSQTNPPGAAGAGGAAGAEKPGAAPAAHGLLNGAARRALQRHSYTPQHNSQALSNAPPATAPLPGYVTKPTQSSLTPSERGYGPPSSAGLDLNNAEPLYVDTNAEAVPYRAMYKYRPQNPDELELQEGDTVYVLEKCDDGWYVGSSQRTGRFGTFPGNYVERI